MGTLIQPGQQLVAGQGQGQLNQYYGYADANQTTVTAAASTTLSTAYSIPANEPYADSAYELTCGGYGTWASSGPQALTLSPFLGAATITGTARVIAAAALGTSAAFQWSATIGITCTDGVSGWQASWLGSVAETASALNPGTAATNSVALAGATSASYTAAVSSALTVALKAQWASTTGAPTITCVRTVFRKVA